MEIDRLISIISRVIGWLSTIKMVLLVLNRLSDYSGNLEIITIYLKNIYTYIYSTLEKLYIHFKQNYPLFIL